MRMVLTNLCKAAPFSLPEFGACVTSGSGRFRRRPGIASPGTILIHTEACMSFDLIKAALLGIVEGLTEFIPVSSTGHLLLMEHFFGFDDEAFGKSFAILIQLGAILAL